MDNALPTDWRPVVAALANPSTRRMYAEVLLADDPAHIGAFLSASKRRHALASLVAAGLVAEVDGRLVERPEVFREVLAAEAQPRRTGPERFLTGDGRIDRYPVDDTKRRALLVHIATRCLTADEVLTEAELNERLARFSPDTALLRREMVDAEVLERTRSGSQYALVSDVAGGACLPPTRRRSVGALDEVVQGCPGPVDPEEQQHQAGDADDGAPDDPGDALLDMTDGVVDVGADAEGQHDAPDEGDRGAPHE